MTHPDRRHVLRGIAASLAAAMCGRGRVAAGAEVPGSEPLVPPVTLDQERRYYRQRGWRWRSDQEPSPVPVGLITRVDVHEDVEADDLWQNVLMFRRTGRPGYRDLAAAWARYYRDEYADSPELEDDIDSYGGDHLVGWGLVDWFRLTGDQRALEAAVRLAGVSERVMHGPWGTYYTGYSTRQQGRHLRLACEVWAATGDPRWKRLAELIVGRLLASTSWVARGAYIGVRNGIPNVASPIHHGVLSDGFWRYWELTREEVVRERLVKMAEFSRTYALHATAQYAGNYVALDYPQPGRIFHGHFDDGNRGFFSVNTVAHVDTLMRGFLLTGDAAFRQRAEYHWERASKALTKATRAPDNQVGRFVNRHFLGGGPFYLENGDLPYATLLFSEAAPVSASGRP